MRKCCELNVFGRIYGEDIYINKKKSSANGDVYYTVTSCSWWCLLSTSHQQHTLNPGKRAGSSSLMYLHLQHPPRRVISCWGLADNQMHSSYAHASLQQTRKVSPLGRPQHRTGPPLSRRWRSTTRTRPPRPQLLAAPSLAAAAGGKKPSPSPSQPACRVARCV